MMEDDNADFSGSEYFFPRVQPRLPFSTSERNVYFMYVCLLSDTSVHRSACRINSYQIKSPNEPEQEPIHVDKCKAVHELVQSFKKNSYSNTEPQLIAATALIPKRAIQAEVIRIEDYKTENEATGNEVAEIRSKYNNCYDDPMVLFSQRLTAAAPVPAIEDIIKPKNESEELIDYDDPKVLQLTKMKWLSEDQEDSTTDSSSTSISITPSESTTSSSLSEDSESSSIGEKYLSTILRLDKEHNLFGLSNITIVGSKQSRKIKKEDERPVFHQTAIVQVCCASGCASCGRLCCKHRTKSDLPASLKCGSCSTCYRSSCVSCAVSCQLPPCKPPSCRPPSCRPPSCRPPPCRPPPCRSPCRSLPCKPSPCKPSPCKPPSCRLSPCKNSPCITPSCVSCKSATCRNNKCTCIKSILGCQKPTCCYGMTIKLNKKPKFDPPPVELTPRNSCRLQLPYIARPCPHWPKCCPPSTCFPYMMPCFWPSRPSAPCNDPTKCFHTPPCMPPRRPRPCVGPRETCKKPAPCKDCHNSSCLGINPAFKAAMTGRFGKPK